MECVDCSKMGAHSTQVLADAGCIWVNGGNTFYLWHHLKASGVDQLVKDRVKEGGALFVGQSAGAIIAGKSIETAFWKEWDDPTGGGEISPSAWDEPGACEALSLIEGVSFFPHFNQKDWAELVASKQASMDHACVTLLDEPINAKKPKQLDEARLRLMKTQHHGRHATKMVFQNQEYAYIVGDDQPT